MPFSACVSLQYKLVVMANKRTRHFCLDLHVQQLYMSKYLFVQEYEQYKAKLIIPREVLDLHNLDSSGHATPSVMRKSTSFPSQHNSFQTWYVNN